MMVPSESRTNRTGACRWPRPLASSRASGVSTMSVTVYSRPALSRARLDAEHCTQDGFESSSMVIIFLFWGKKICVNTYVSRRTLLLLGSCSYMTIEPEPQTGRVFSRFENVVSGRIVRSPHHLWVIPPVLRILRNFQTFFGGRFWVLAGSLLDYLFKSKVVVVVRPLPVLTVTLVTFCGWCFCKLAHMSAAS